MTTVSSFELGRIWVLRMSHGDDLYQAVTDFARNNGIRMATLSGLGAVTRAQVAYYHQDRKVYESHIREEGLEILNAVGNISLLDGQPFVHLHATFSDKHGAAWGGHLQVGTTVYACEFTIQELIGDPLERDKMDALTGLRLWCADRM